MAEQYVLDRMTVLLSVALVVVLVAGATYVFTSGAQPAPVNLTNASGEVPKISVSGEATRTVAPDLLVMGIAVETGAETASEAQGLNAQMTERVKTALLSEGIRADEIETGYYSTYPVYNDSCWYYPREYYGDGAYPAGEEIYYGEGYAEPRVAYTDEMMVEPAIYPAPPSYRCEPEVIGYRTVHSIMVRTSAIYRGGDIIDAVSDANAGARLDYQYFSLKEETRIRVENELAGEAAASAREKAESIASGLGASLGRIVDIQTDYYYPYYGYRDYAVAEASVSMVGGEVPTEIFPQDLSMSSRIYVSFEIAQ